MVEVSRRPAPPSSRTRKRARCELKALQRLREGEENVAMREEAHMEGVTERVRIAADSARAAEGEWGAALQDQADFVAGSAGGRPPAASSVASAPPSTGAGGCKSNRGGSKGARHRQL